MQKQYINKIEKMLNNNSSELEINIADTQTVNSIISYLMSKITTGVIVERFGTESTNIMVSDEAQHGVVLELNVEELPKGVTPLTVLPVFEQSFN
jgi:hypothetical protein